MKIKGTILIALFLVQTITCIGISNVKGQTTSTQTWSPFGPRGDAFLFRIITSYEARLAAFEADEIDMVGVLPADVERIRKNRPDAVFMETQAWGSQSIFFNMRNWPLSDVRVRKAIAHLIDREGYIMPEILKGYGLPLYTVIMPTLGSWFNPNVKTYEYSLDKANKYLDEAGFKWDAEHKWRLDPKTGQTLRPIGLMTTTQAAGPNPFAIAVYFAKQCEKVGIKIQHEAVESAAVRTRRVRDVLDFDIYHWGWTGIGPESDWPFRFFHSQFDCAKVPGSWNRYGVNDPALDKVLEDFVNAPDIPKAKEYLFKAQEMLQEILPWVPVYSTTGITAVSGKVKGTVYSSVPGLTYPLGRNMRISDMNEYTPELPFGMTLRRAYVDVYTLNPATYTWADEGDILDRMYEPYTIGDPKDASDSTKRIPRFLQSIKTEQVEISPKGKATKATLSFARNVTWHDGLPVTTRDVDFCIWKLGKEQQFYRYSDKWILDTYKTEIIDDYTMNIYVNSTGWFTWIDLVGGLSYVLPKHLWETVKNIKAAVPPREKHPTNPDLSMLTGSGMWIMKEFVAGNYVLSVWNPNYYMRNPEKGLVFEQITLPASIYDDESTQISLKLTDYLKKTVENGTVKATFQLDSKVAKEISLSHKGGGTYSATVSGLEAGSYKILLKAEQGTKYGKLARSQTTSFTVNPAWQKYAPYLAVIAVVAAAVLVYMKKVKTKK